MKVKKITVSYEIFGAIKTRLKETKGNISIEKNTTLEDFLIQKAGIAKKYITFMDITINSKHYTLDKKLKKNMKIKILMPVGGG